MHARTGLPAVVGCDRADRGWNVWRHEVQQVVPLFGGEVAPGVNLDPVGIERRAADLIRWHAVLLAVGSELLHQRHLILRSETMAKPGPRAAPRSRSRSACMCSVRTCVTIILPRPCPSMRGILEAL